MIGGGGNMIRNLEFKVLVGGKFVEELEGRIIAFEIGIFGN